MTETPTPPLAELEDGPPDQPRELPGRGLNIVEFLLSMPLEDLDLTRVEDTGRDFDFDDIS